MFKIDSEGATVDNLFTEGDPALGVPATVVSADWLNAVQGELVNFIELMGIALDKNDDAQMSSALLEFFLRGGRQNPISVALANNTAAIDVTGFTFDKTKVKSKIALYTIERKSDAANKQETGLVFVTYDSADDDWRVTPLSVHDFAGVTFAIAAVDANISKLQCTTDNMAGGSYLGNISLTSIFEIRS